MCIRDSCPPGASRPGCGGRRLTLACWAAPPGLSLIHISEPTRLLSISYAVFCLKKKKAERAHTQLTDIHRFFDGLLECLGHVFFFFLRIRRPPRSTRVRSSAASDVYKRQGVLGCTSG